MRITVSKQNLEKALQSATIAVGSGGDTDLVAHYLFRHMQKTDTLFVLSQNSKRLCAQVPVTGAAVEDLDDQVDETSCTVPAVRIHKLLSVLKKDDNITLALVDGVIKATSPQGVGKLGSLSTKDFPYWDETLAAATTTATIKADHLARILANVKSYISDQETRGAELVATECIDGTLWATDLVGVALVKSPVLKDATFRIHGKDVSSVLAFLGLCEETEDVELREHARCLFIVRNDGTTLGVSRWISKLPTLKRIKADPTIPSKYQFTIKTADLLQGVAFLDVFAKKDDSHLRFQYAQGNIILSMASGSGALEADEYLIPCSDTENMDALAVDGFKFFTLAKKYVDTLAKSSDQESLVFRVDVASQNGFVSHYAEQDGDLYKFVIVWLRD